MSQLSNPMLRLIETFWEGVILSLQIKEQILNDMSHYLSKRVLTRVPSHHVCFQFSPDSATLYVVVAIVSSSRTSVSRQKIKSVSCQRKKYQF